MVASVREILDLGEGGRVTSNEIFTPGPDGRAVPTLAPRCLPDLVAAGLDPGLLHRQQGWWDQQPDPVGNKEGLRWVG